MVSGDIPKLAELIISANNHEGFAVIDVLQPCVTFNKEFTHQFFQENTYYLDSGYDPYNKIKAYEKSQEVGNKKLALGIIYQAKKPSYESQIPSGKPENGNLSELYKSFT